MAKIKPNDTSLHLESTPKFLDTDGKYKPFYIAPCATDAKRGDVYLSDSTNSAEAAADGVTAATPKAVKAANDNADSRLSKTATSAQSVASDVTFNGTITANKQIKGSISGNAGTATKLATGRTITVTADSTNATGNSKTFDGSQNININLNAIDAAAITKGTLPLGVIPQGALERLVTVQNQTARFALTTATVQKGDTVRQADTGVLYMVVDDSKLNNADGYVEYKAGTALKANEATHATSADSATSATKATQDSQGQQINTTYIKGLSVNGRTITYTKGNNSTGTITTQDTTYSNFTAATASAAGKAGLVPAPPAGAQSKFLRGDGSWQVAGEVTGVKGSVETSYRTGQVNITAANVGALPTSGGALTGNVSLTMSGQQDIKYMVTNANTGKSISLMIGSGQQNRGVYDHNGNRWMIYADANNNVYVNGNASTATTATTATKANALNQTLSLTSDVTGSVNMNTSGDKSITATIGNSKVTTAKIADSNVTTAKIADSAVTTAKVNAKAITAAKIADATITATQLASSAVETAKIKDANVTNAKIADSAVGLAKLGSDVGTVYVGASEPSDERIKVWVKI